MTSPPPNSPQPSPPESPNPESPNPQSPNPQSPNPQSPNPQSPNPQSPNPQSSDVNPSDGSPSNPGPSNPGPSTPAEPTSAGATSQPDGRAPGDAAAGTASSPATAAASGAARSGPVVVLVPAHNEASRIGATITSLRTIPEVVEVLVVDDGSTDDTRDEALAAGAHCLALPHNRGKGGALNAGLLALTSRVADGITPVPAVLLLADADLADTAAQLRSLLVPVLDGTADLAIADLPAQDGAGGFGLAMGLARGGIGRLGGQQMAEPLSGQRALAWENVSDVVPFASGFGVEVAMTLRALSAGLRVVEIPVDLRHAATGRDWAGIRHRARQAGAIGRELGRAQTQRLTRRARRLPGLNRREGAS